MIQVLYQVHTTILLFVLPRVYIFCVYTVLGYMKKLETRIDDASFFSHEYIIISLFLYYYGS